MKYDHRIMGQLIGKMRVQQGLSQEELSTKAGIARSYLAMIENGLKRANVDTLWKIAKGLGSKLSDLFKKIEDE